MNVFFHGKIEAGFDVLKARSKVIWRVRWVNGSPSIALPTLVTASMCAMNVTDMEELGKFMSKPEELKWDQDHGATYKAYMMQEMLVSTRWPNRSTSEKIPLLTPGAPRLVSERDVSLRWSTVYNRAHT